MLLFDLALIIHYFLLVLIPERIIFHAGVGCFSSSED